MVVRISIVVMIVAAVLGCSSKSSGDGERAKEAMKFSGAYEGSIQGTAAKLSLQRTGERITGTIDAQGYTYRFEGNVDGTRATGTLSDPATGATMPFEATASGNDVRFTVSAQGTTLDLAFSRPGGATAAGAGGATAARGERQEADPRLVGSWRYTERLGDTQTGYGLIVWQLIVRADGTYTYGNDRSQTNGRWRTRGDVVEVSDDGASWSPHARFIADGSTLLFTLGDGTKQLWERQ